MRRTRIIGTGSYVPPRVVGNEELSRWHQVDPAGIYRRTGIQTRRWASEGQVPSTMAEQAARQACDAAGVSPSSIDAIMVSTTSPDMVLPSTACHLQSALGVQGVAAFDLAASCSGFLYGLSMADCMIKSGMIRRALVVAAEVKSRFLDMQDEGTAILFADGAGAALVSDDGEGGGGAGNVMGVRLYADGSRRDLITLPAGGSRQPVTRQTVMEGKHTIRLRGGPLFRVAIRRLAQAAQDILKEFGLRVSDVQRVIFHQANGRLLEALRDRLDIPPEKMFSVIERFGNTSSASLPIALDQAVRQGHVTSGDVILLGAFGGGLTWATGLVRW